MISSARALSRLFSFWPFDEDSCFSTSSEICYKFPLLSSARRDLNKIRKSKSRTKARRNVSTLLEALPITTHFAPRYRFPKMFLPYVASFFNIFQFSLGKLNLNAFCN